MNRVRVLAALLACAAMGASATLHAQARGSLSREARGNAQQVEQPPPELDEAARATRIAEMEAWLRRLVGRFRTDQTWVTGDNVLSVEGFTNKTYSTAVCSGIGDGPGVRCLVGEPVTDNLFLPGLPVFTIAESQLGVLPILYFGINPGTLEIQLVMVDHIAAQVGVRSGMLAGDTVNFSGDSWKMCHEAPSGRCWEVAGITATPAGEIFMKFAYDLYYQGRKNPLQLGHSVYMDAHLHRELPVDAEIPREAP